MRFPRQFLALALLLTFPAPHASGQAYIFGTFAGYAGNGSNGQFAIPQGIAVDGGGSVYVADSGNNTICKIDSVGTVTLLAGQPGVSGSADGVGTNALFNQPSAMAVDLLTNLYVADFANDTVRKISPSGAVTTIAGCAGVAGSNNGLGTNALFSHPAGVAVDTLGNVYVSDYGNDTIRVITPGGGVSTLAGSPGNDGSADGSGAAAQFYQPSGIAFGNNALYVADTANNTIRRVTPAGAVTTIAGTAGALGFVDGQGTGAMFHAPAAVAVDGAGNVYIADALNNSVRLINNSGAVTTLIPPPAGLNDPLGVAVDANGNLFIADSGNNMVWEWSNAELTTVAGAPSADGSDGMGAQARFDAPESIAADAAGNSYVADTGNSTVRKISAAGAVTTLAGSDSSLGSADGAGTNALFFAPRGVASDAAGNLYLADTGNDTIRQITPGGSVSTIAGTAGFAGTADGSGASAHFNHPQGVAVDGGGTVYVADTGNNTIRKIVSGAVTTLAGSIYQSGSLDGTGTNALFYQPRGVAADGSGNVYVADTLNHTVREINSAGVVVTVAGTPGVYGSADGAGSNALFREPSGIAIDSSGNLYVADTGNQTLRKIVPGTFAVSTIAGTAGFSGSADGAGAGAMFSYPGGIAAATSGFLWVADSANNTVRLDSAIPPQILTQPQSQTNFLGATVFFSVTASGTGPLNYIWQENGAPAGGNSNTLAAAVAGNYWTIVSNPAGSVTSLVATLTLTNPSPGGFQTIALLGNGQVQLTLDGTPGATYSVETSTNLVQWTTLAQVTASNGTAQYSDGLLTNVPARFYRLQP